LLPPFFFLDPPSAPAPPVPRFDHIVVVIEENHSFSQVAESAYFADLASRGALFRRSYAVTHPSQPNYVALFSGSTRGITNDAHHDLRGSNLASSLAAAGLSFASYCEDLPYVGFRGDASGPYVRKHNPAAIFADVPGADNQPLTAFPTDFAKLPTVSFVIPNFKNDMHDGSVATGDAWLRAHIDSYSRWAASHNSLLIVTFDEGRDSLPPADTPIFTVLVGARVRPGPSDQPITHYSILRTMEDMYGLSPIAEDGKAQPISGIWQ